MALQVTLFDVQQRTAVADLNTPFIKYIVWSSDMNHVALLSKHAIIIANKRLGQASTGVSPCHPPPSPAAEAFNSMSCACDGWPAGTVRSRQ